MGCSSRSSHPVPSFLSAVPVYLAREDPRQPEMLEHPGVEAGDLADLPALARLLQRQLPYDDCTSFWMTIDGYKRGVRALASRSITVTAN